MICLAALALAIGPVGQAQADSSLGGGLLQWFVEGSSKTARAEPYTPDWFTPDGAARRRPADADALVTASAPAEGGRQSVPAQFQRQEIDYSGPEKPGSIIIDTERHFLFFILPGSRAIRYGVGVGRPGFEWAGVKSVTRKAEWPDWTPPVEMMLRQPDIPDHMAGGPGNPLGARALYLGSSLYRIHGTNEPWTIGKNVSSGCIRMMNADVIDLYNRVPVGAKVVVM